MIEKIDLCGSWSVEDSLGTRFVGTVPGCVHTDLFTKDEMFFEKNSDNTKFVEERDYTYRREFLVDKLLPSAILAFDGLDTYADIYLNGTLVGSADNMFIPHKFPVDGILREGRNEVEVRFTSPVRAVEGKPELIGCFTTERLHSRRMQCTYGWDWVDRFVTMGIFRPAYVAFLGDMDLRDVYVYTESIDKYSAKIKAVLHFSDFEGGSLVKCEIISPSGKVLLTKQSTCLEEEYVFRADIRDPELWYPHNYGDQPLYTLRITVGDNVRLEKFGIRTVKILELEDIDEEDLKLSLFLKNTESGLKYDQNEKTSGFIILVNGVRIFCTGANWVPSEPFPSAETKEKITTLLERSRLAGINMIRVWGGGIFECEHFYNECDRLGILISQDFLMACGHYPEREPDFQDHLRREAEFAAIYLRNHPSLVFWSGDNENAVNGDDVMVAYPGRISARSVIAPVLERLDYNRVFLFSSPYGGTKYASKTVGTTHNTQFMGYFFNYVFRDDISDYREWWLDTTARFIAEEPNMGAVCPESMREFISDENIERRDMWLYHTKTNKGLKRELMDITAEFAFKLFGDADNFEDRYFKLRYVQYEWVRISLGNARAHAWFNSGIVYWMLNDCWPSAVGWSLLDYYTRPKAGYYAIKSFSRDINLYLTKGSDGYIANVSNVKDEPAKIKLTAFALDLKTGAVRDLTDVSLTAESGSTRVNIDTELKDSEILIAEAEWGGRVERSWYKTGTPTLRRTDAFTSEISGNTVTVKADSYIHALEIDGAGLVEDNYFSMLQDETRKINIDPDRVGSVKINAFTLEV